MPGPLSFNFADSSAASAAGGSVRMLPEHEGRELYSYILRRISSLIFFRHSFLLSLFRTGLQRLAT
jgi:hypothetical protein